jgi:hypothetical protein
MLVAPLVSDIGIVHAIAWGIQEFDDLRFCALGPEGAPQTGSTGSTGSTGRAERSGGAGAPGAAS